MIYPVSTDTFTIYDNGASIVGKIDDAELRNSVVKTYGLAKSLIAQQLNGGRIQTTVTLISPARPRCGSFGPR
ncbi:protein of unknown function [Paraburkholderia kururiensis]